MKLDGLDHPKTNDFASRLNVTRPTAIGHLELLWAFVGKQAAQGNIGKWPDGAIARACDWMGPPEIFISALIDSGFVDPDPSFRLTVHDWSDHAPGWVRAKLKKVGLPFIASSERSSERSSDGDQERSSEGSEGDLIGDTREGSKALENVLKSTSEPSSRAPVSKGRVGKGREEPLREAVTSPSVGLLNVVEFGNSTASGESPKALELDLQKPPEPEPPDPKAERRAAAGRIFDHWRITHEHERAQLEDKRLKLIFKALDSGYSEADLCQAITGYLNSPHHMGENDRNTKYDSIELMLRGSKFIDQGLKFYAEPPRTERSKLMRRNLSATAGWMPPELRNAAK
jgi:hypothetical protein